MDKRIYEIGDRVRCVRPSRGYEGETGTVKAYARVSNYYVKMDDERDQDFFVEFRESDLELVKAVYVPADTERGLW